MGQKEHRGHLQGTRESNWANFILYSTLVGKDSLYGDWDMILSCFVDRSLPYLAVLDRHQEYHSHASLPVLHHFRSHIFITKEVIMPFVNTLTAEQMRSCLA